MGRPPLGQLLHYADRRYGVFTIADANRYGVSRRVLARVDRVRGLHDQRARRLAKDLGQPRHRHRPAGQQVAEHAPGPDRRELIGVADEQHVRARADRGEQRVECRSLVEDVLGDGVAFAGVAKFPARVKCALLPWMAFKDAAARAGVDVGASPEVKA